MGSSMNIDDSFEFSVNDLFSEQGFAAGGLLNEEIFHVAEELAVFIHNEDEILCEVIKVHLLREVRRHHVVDVCVIDYHESGFNPVRAMQVDGEAVDLADSRWCEHRGIQLKPSVVHVSRAEVLDTVRWAVSVQAADFRVRVSMSRGGRLAERIIAEFPDFARDWEADFGNFVDDNFMVSACSTMLLFGRSINRRLISGDIDSMEGIFALLEVLINDPDSEIGNATAVCCLEELVETLRKHVSQADLCQWLGPESRKLCRVFGVLCEK